MEKPFRIALFLGLLFGLLNISGKAQDLTNGLISVWEFDETSGTILTDSYGNNDGTNNGATVNQTGQIVKAYDFEESESDYIEVPSDSLGFEYDDAFSISVWVKVETNTNPQIINNFDSIWPNFTGWGFWLEPDGGVTFSIMSGSGSNAIYGSTSESILTGVWNHLAVSYDGSGTLSGVTIYINGVASTSWSSSLDYISGSILSPRNVSIGGRDDGMGAFDGLIDQVAIWGKELTGAEVDSLYNSSNGLPFLQWGGSTPLSGGSISPDSLIITSGSSPGTISNVTVASGGSGTITYMWEESVNNGSSWTIISGETDTSYNAPSLTQTTWYRRVAMITGVDTAYSNESHITVTPVDTTGGGQGLTAGLISVWEFNETSGTTVADSYGNNDGTNYGATINQTGKFDKAYSFDGTDDYVEIDDQASWKELNGKDFSVNIWINTTNLETTGRGIIGTYSTLSAGAPSPNQFWQIYR